MSTFRGVPVDDSGGAMVDGAYFKREYVEGELEEERSAALVVAALTPTRSILQTRQSNVRTRCFGGS